MPARPGAGNRTHRDLAVLQTHQDLRRGTDDLEVRQVQEEHIRRGVEAAQGAIQVQRPRLEGDAQALRDHHLHAVPVQDVAFDPFYRRLETRLGETRNEIRFVDPADGLWRMPRGAGLHHCVQLGDPRPRIRKGLSGIDVRMHHDIHTACQIVEHHQFVRHHQQDVRSLQRIGFIRIGQARLDIGHRVIAEIAHQAPMETRQVLDIGHPEAGAEFIHIGQRIHDLEGLAVLVRALQRHLMAANAEAGAARQADDRVTPPFFATVDRLEQIAVRSANQL